MPPHWSKYFSNLLAALLGFTLAGALVGYPAVGLAIGLSLALIWELSQMYRLMRWLNASTTSSEVPESIGPWRDLFDGIHRLQRRHLRVRDQLQAEVNRVQDFTDAMRDGVIMTNDKGVMEWWNGAAEYLLGFRKNSDRGLYIHNLIRTPVFKEYFDRRGYKEPLQIPSPDKPHIQLQLHVSPFGDDGRLIVVKDITRLVQLEQMRRDFISNVSHEMRTPLTVISGYLETMVDYSDQLPSKWHRAINTMYQQSSRMEALLTDLLLLSKLETGDQLVDDRVTDLKPLLEQVCQDARALSADKGHVISLTVGDRHYLRGDESQLRSAFSNLIFNAVKYTPAGGSITVNWATDKQGGHLSVQDTGIGIDAVHIPRLTERFYRADPSRHQETGGTGLGLAIVKHVAINHDGNLDIRSEVGKGSEFICHFPRARLAEQPVADEPTGTD